MPLALKENICRAHRLPRNDTIIMGRAEMLASEDRDLVEAVLVHGQPTRLVAKMMGIGPRVVRKRIYILGRRLTSRRFLDAARALQYLPPEDAKLARLRFCEGATQRQLSARLDVSLHVLRRRLDRISAEITTIRRLFRSKELLQGK